MSDVKRVIKFRAWDGDKMINPPGYEGTGSGVMIYQLDFEGRVSLTNLYGLDPLEGGAANTTIDNLILMQFTGLHDKNGKEIYEGDVLRVWTREKSGYDYVGKVEYESAKFILIFGEVKFPFVPVLSMCAASSEVIDNIYSNPELLKS